MSLQTIAPMTVDNRRNFYRILEVQPDAPFEVIKHNHKLLLHKLRMHPDFGGDQRDAALINSAFDTLRDPKKRAAYDQKLLRQNNIATLSQGHLRRPQFFPRKQNRFQTVAQEANQRNYYRILQVQTDAHAAIIRERYLALVNQSALPRELLDEAYLVLNNAQKRIEYDRLLKRFGHSKAVQKMRARIDALAANDSDLPHPLPTQSAPYVLTGSRTSPSHENGLAYQPLITQYCAFCKTPHAASPLMDHEKFCPVCSSPLFSSGKDRLQGPTRALDRILKQGTIIFYVYWPSRGLFGQLVDISPQGLRFSTGFGLDIGQIIKIDGEQFKGVAEVVHSQAKDSSTSNGVRFRTIAFRSATGNFLRTTV